VEQRPARSSSCLLLLLGVFRLFLVLPLEVFDASSVLTGAAA